MGADVMRSPGELVLVLNRMVLVWGTATMWRIQWAPMIAAMAVDAQQRGARPDWHEHVGRA